MLQFFIIFKQIFTKIFYSYNLIYFYISKWMDTLCRAFHLQIANIFLERVSYCICHFWHIILGVLNIFCWQVVHSFLFLPLFPYTGYQREATFLEPVVKVSFFNVSFTFRSVLSPMFTYNLEGQILEQGKSNFLDCTPMYQWKSSFSPGCIIYLMVQSWYPTSLLYKY